MNNPPLIAAAADWKYQGDTMGGFLGGPPMYNTPQGVFSELTHRVWRVTGFRQEETPDGDNVDLYVRVRSLGHRENETWFELEFSVSEDEYNTLSLGDVLHIKLTRDSGIS